MLSESSLPVIQHHDRGLICCPALLLMPRPPTNTIDQHHHTAQVFSESSLPVIQHYDAQGKVYRMPADRPVDDVYSDVRRLFLD